MRCYHLNNFYMGGIHAGIQTAHAQHELALKYIAPWKSHNIPPAGHDYVTWADEHKTIIVLNGGMQSDLQSVLELLDGTQHDYAYAPFHESNDALNGALTNIGIVLPPRMYKFSRDIVSAVQDGREGLVVDNKRLRLLLGRNDAGFTIQFLETDRSGNRVGGLTPDAEMWEYNQFDIQLMSKLCYCSLM